MEGSLLLSFLETFNLSAETDKDFAGAMFLLLVIGPIILSIIDPGGGGGE